MGKTFQQTYGRPPRDANELRDWQLSQGAHRMGKGIGIRNVQTDSKGNHYGTDRSGVRWCWKKPK